jgi:E3 ubiquitin-protein ligase RNF115/126
MRIELGADASPDDVVAATRQIVRRLAGADGTRVAAASAATAETEIATVAREAWSALLGARGLNFPSRTEYVASPFGLSAGGTASFQLGGSIPAGRLDSRASSRVPTAEAFFGGDVNIAELDTRTFFSPAHPDAVERLPRVTVAERGNRTGDQPGARGDDDDTGCPVCLTDMGHGPEGATLREMPCGHRFHEACLLEWLRTKHTCPVCRVALPSAPGGAP